MCKTISMLALLVLLTGCASSGKHPVSWDQVDQVGFKQQEVIDLGQVINIAYTLFDTHSKENNPPFPKPFFNGYSPIMNLQAEDDVYTDGRELYGHLSWKLDSPGTLVITIRGTSDKQEWIDDAKFFKEPYSDDPKLGCVELGFKEIFSSFTVAHPKQAEIIPLNDYLANMKGVKRIIVAGHSLGSSLATLVAFDASLNDFADSVEVLTFASPLTGDKTFVKAFEQRIKNSLRVVNKPDIVPRVPPKLFGFRHVWHELEINSRQHADIAHNLVCYHSLLTYLNILSNGTVGLETKCSEKH